VIHLKNGRAIQGRCEVMKGEPSNPHRREDVERKFYDLMVPVWGSGRSQKLYGELMALEDVPDVSALEAEIAR